MIEDRYPKLRIFVSHSGKNNDFGFRLFDDLKYFLGSNKYIWYDAKGGLVGGDDWIVEIEKEIKRCTRFIVLLTKEALNPSRWVDEEISIAYRRYVMYGKPLIIPIKFDNCRIPTRLSRIGKLHFIYCRTPEEYRSSFQEIIKALRLPGDPIGDFLQRESLHIEEASRSSSTDEILRGTYFLLFYFPEAVSTGIYWKRTLSTSKRDVLHSFFHRSEHH